MRTAQNTHARPPIKEDRGFPRLSVVLGLVLVLGLGACRSPSRHGYPPTLPYAWTVGIDGTPRQLAQFGDVDLRRAAVRAMRESRHDADVAMLVTLLDDRDVDVAADAALALAVSPARGARGRLVAALGPDARAEVVTAAALGLGSQPGDDAERGLLSLARRPERPAAVPGALLNHYRWRGRPAAPRVGDPALLDYAEHASAEGRAGFGHYARAVKDPAVLPFLIRLCGDEDAEVRRAAAIGLARSSAAPWPEERESDLVSALTTRLADDDARVVVAACRALASFESSVSWPALRGALDHADFNVRVAAVESFAKLDVDTAPDAFDLMAREDASVSVRGAAASAVAALDPALAAEIADDVLADPAEFVRAAGCELLAAIPDDGKDAATVRLAELAVDDPHVRVRHTALGALEGRSGDVVTDAVRRALAEDEDPVVVAVACGVAASNDLDELLWLVREVPDRFPGRMGADAREGALGALAAFGTLDDVHLLRAYVDDANPSVAFAAQQGLAALGGSSVPSPERAGVRNAGPADLNSFVGREPVSLIVETSRGTMRIDLDAGAAPLHVAHVVAVAQRGDYDGLSWHRVVPDFVIQGACPRGDGAGSVGVSLPLESTRIPFERGVLGMPRSGHPDSGGCQLFVMHSRAPHLDVHYTAFGRVTQGLDVIDRIDVDDRIVSVRVVRSRGESR